MRSQLLCALVFVGLAPPARSGEPGAGSPGPPPLQHDKLGRSEVVATGKVMEIEKDAVPAAPLVGVGEKVQYRIAVVKVETALVGATGVTHLRVGFVPPDPNAPPVRGSGGVIRPSQPVPELTNGQNAILYLCKHPTADFYVMPGSNLPADLSTDAGKKELAVARRFAAALADPLKGLKSDKPAVRAETAAFLLAKYTSGPVFGASETVEVDAAESRLILAGLAAGDWTSPPTDGGPTPVLAFNWLRLTEHDGWKPPAAQPGENPLNKAQAAFRAWLDGPGKDYRVKKVVPKK